MRTILHENDELFLSHLPIRHMRELFERWCLWRGTEQLPSRQSLDPMQLASSLPYISLIRITYEPRAYEIRLVGEEIINGTGINLAGHMMHDIEGSEEGVARLDDVIERRVPILDRDIPMQWSPRDYRACSCLNLPFRGDDNNVRDVIMCMSFDN